MPRRCHRAYPTKLILKIFLNPSRILMESEFLIPGSHLHEYLCECHANPNLHWSFGSPVGAWVSHTIRMRLCGSQLNSYKFWCPHDHFECSKCSCGSRVATGSGRVGVLIGRTGSNPVRPPCNIQPTPIQPVKMPCDYTHDSCDPRLTLVWSPFDVLSWL